MAPQLRETCVLTKVKLESELNEWEADRALAGM